jgi:glycosyltransferase involved in cell wall biosynthesis
MPKCTVITPIGPGHAEASAACVESVKHAMAFSTGPFSSVEHLTIDDTQARLGRSAARNHGVRTAAAAGSDWLFFLDADDLLLPEAFTRLEPWIETHEAVWGAICELTADSPAPRIRALQDQPLRTLAEFLQSDPFYALQIGHFVRTRVALALPFAEHLDTGEDYDYYLRVWANHRCTKIAAPLFINRRGQHSSGPRSATGREWGRTVRRLRLQFISDHRDELRVLGVGHGNRAGVRRRERWRIRWWQLHPLGLQLCRLLGK